MKVFQKLKFDLGTVTLDDWLSRAAPYLQGNWQRAADIENEAKASGINDPYLCFELQNDPMFSPVVLVLSADEPGAPMEVINIISRQRSSLSHDEYNSLLARFHTEVVEPSLRGTTVGVDVSSPDVEIEDLAPSSVAEALRQFSVLANKSTGASHPLDQERWFSFVVASHRSGKPMEVEMLTRWLVEKGGWTSEWAHDLSIQYEQQVALLSYYDRTTRG